MSSNEASRPRTRMPPSWYAIKTSPGGHPYIALPAKPDRLQIYLTPFYASDLTPLQILLNIPSINERLISVPNPYTAADAKFWIDLQLSGTSALQLQALRSHDPESGAFIGAVSLLPTESPDGTTEYELGYYLDPEFQRQGIMRDAVLAELTWGMGEKGVANVKVYAVETNLGSRELIESLGLFEREERVKEIKWPESKGGGTQRLVAWRWKA